MGDSTVESEVFGAMEDWFHSPSPAALSVVKKFLSNDGSGTVDKDSCLLKKASILRSIEDRIADGSVPEGVLDSLLLIEQVDRSLGVPVSDSMRAAFSAIALHCALCSLPLSWPSYYDSVLRIWGVRLRCLEESGTTQLLGPDLAKWRHDVEAALWDSNSSQKLMRLNTCGDALLCLRLYLREASSSIRPAFLRLAFPASQDPPAAASPPPTAPDKGKRILRANSQKRYKLGASRRRCKGPVVIADVEEERPSCGNYGFLSSAEVNKVQEALKSSMADLRDAVTDPLPEALKVAERAASILEERNNDKDVCAISVNPTLDVPATSLNPNTEHTQATGRNLHARAIAEHENRKDKSTSSSPSIPPTSKPAQDKEGNEENQAFVHQKKVPRPSLMERNGTARTHEREDSIDVSGRSSALQRCRLPIPKVKLVSPLRECELKKWKRMRRRNMWSFAEEQALADGVLKLGTHWNLILKSNPEAFIDRTAVDLKDKWRNMQGR